MTTLERVKTLCKERGISIAQLEDRLDIPNNTIYQWNGKKRPNLEKLEKLTEYFDVSTDYLLGKTEVRNWKVYDDQLTDKHFDLVKEAENKFSTLNDKEKKDIALQADMLLEGLENGENLNFYGEPATNEQKERLRVAIRTAMAMNKEEAKKKFTRKDYRK